MSVITDAVELYGNGRIPLEPNVSVVTAPIVYPVTVDETKTHLRIDESDQDTLLLALIAAATRVLEDSCAMSFLASSYCQVQNWAARNVKLLRFPLLSVSAVKTIANFDADTEVVMDSANYSVLTKTNAVMARTVWPTHRNYQSFLVYYKAGYGDAGTDTNDANTIAAARALVPAPIKTAIMDLTGHLYENPEGQGAEVKYESQLKSFGDLPLMIQRLMAPYQRRQGIF